MPGMQWDRARRQDPVRWRGGDLAAPEPRAGHGSSTRGRSSYRALSLVLARLDSSALAEVRAAVAGRFRFGPDRWEELFQHLAAGAAGPFEPTAPPTAMFDHDLRRVLEAMSPAALDELARWAREARAEHRDDLDVRSVWIVITTQVELARQAGSE